MKALNWNDGQLLSDLLREIRDLDKENYPVLTQAIAKAEIMEFQQNLAPAPRRPPARKKVEKLPEVAADEEE